MNAIPDRIPSMPESFVTDEEVAGWRRTLRSQVTDERLARLRRHAERIRRELWIQYWSDPSAFGDGDAIREIAGDLPVDIDAVLEQEASEFR